MATKKQNKAKAIGTNTKPVSSQQEANERFCASIGTQGQSGSIGAFVALMDRILDTKRSFSWPDVVEANKLFEIDVWLLEKLFKRYTEAMEAFCILESVEGCYDYPVWFRLA